MTVVNLGRRGGEKRGERGERGKGEEKRGERGKGEEGERRRGRRGRRMCNGSEG